jgi:hypothetical protein
MNEFQEGGHISSAIILFIFAPMAHISNSLQTLVLRIRDIFNISYSVGTLFEPWLSTDYPDQNLSWFSLSLSRLKKDIYP